MISNSAVTLNVLRFAATLFVAIAGMTLVAADAPKIVNRIPVEDVWSGHPVGFAIRNHDGRQYIAYYDADRHMSVASRKLDSDVWEHKKLDSRIGWDSHNYITIEFDSDGQLHVVGNMHVTPLVYYRSTVPGEISSLERVSSMTGELENRMTYPSFVKNRDGTLVFHYRDGGSGNGIQIFNKYDVATKRWTRLLDKPLFDGQGRKNAYFHGPILGPDDWWHIVWVWRDTPDASTNHDLSYARSKDLINWETVDGKPLPIPLTASSEGVIIDPVPVNGGMLNGSPKIGFDAQDRVIVSYYKFDEGGASQVYLARAEEGAWNIARLTDWTHRWEPKGYGSISPELDNSAVSLHPELGMLITLANKVHGGGIWIVDHQQLKLERTLSNEEMPNRLPSELFRSKRPNMRVRSTRTADDEKIYLLRWETLDINRDLAHEGQPPAPYPMELIILEK